MRSSAKISKIKTIKSIHEGNGVAAKHKKNTVFFFFKWFWLFRINWVEVKISRIEKKSKNYNFPLKSIRRFHTKNCKRKNNINITYVPRLVIAATLLQSLPFYGGQRCQSHRSRDEKDGRKKRWKRGKGN